MRFTFCFRLKWDLVFHAFKTDLETSSYDSNEPKKLFKGGKYGQQQKSHLDSARFVLANDMLFFYRSGRGSSGLGRSPSLEPRAMVGGGEPDLQYG